MLERKCVAFEKRQPSRNDLWVERSSCQHLIELHKYNFVENCQIIYSRHTRERPLAEHTEAPCPEGPSTAASKTHDALDAKKQFRQVVLMWWLHQHIQSLKYLPSSIESLLFMAYNQHTHI